MKANTLTPIMSFMTRFYRNSIFSTRLFSENILKLLPLLLTGMILFSVNGCEEPPSKIGESMLPGTDFVYIKSTDSVSVKSYTMYKDSVESDAPSISYLGSMYDPYFGTSTAGFVSQLRIYPSSLLGEDYFVIDSVKLNLKLTTIGGDTAAEHFLKFSEISQQLYPKTKYYSNQTPPLTGVADSWSVTLPSLRADTINDIVVTIPKTFGEHIIRDKAMLFMKDSSVISDFRSYFKGLYFEIFSPDAPIFASVSLASSGSNSSYTNYFTLYMHDEVAKSLVYDLPIDLYNTNAAYNLFNHDFSTAEPDKKIKHINDMYPDTLSYIQNMNGVYTRIEMPSLKALKDNPALDNIAINKARLVIPFVTGAGAIYATTIPSIVYLRYMTTTGHKWLVSDYSTAGTTFYDGTPDTTTAFSYNINIATYLQMYLEDTADTLTSNFELFLLPTSSYNAVLKANKSHNPVKFELTYTKF
jgi:hypothetical protein